MKEQILNELNKVNRIGIKDLIDYLVNSDFFVAPSSTKYHSSFKGGLAIHSWNVYLLLKEKNERFKMGLSEESVIICGLLHDVCKINFYKPGIDKYFVDDKFPVGHGEKSVFIIQKYIKLTEKEICMIRWHVGFFDVSKNIELVYYAALRVHPECLAMYTADHEATIYLEEQNDNNSRRN